MAKSEAAAPKLKAQANRNLFPSTSPQKPRLDEPFYQHRVASGHNRRRFVQNWVPGENQPG